MDAYRVIMHVEEVCSVFVGKKAGEMLHFVNVLDYADAGKVDPHSPEDGSFDNLDLDNIRRFVQLDIRLRTQGKRPSVMDGRYRRSHVRCSSPSGRNRGRDSTTRRSEG